MSYVAVDRLRFHKGAAPPPTPVDPPCGVWQNIQTSVVPSASIFGFVDKLCFEFLTSSAVDVFTMKAAAIMVDTVTPRIILSFEFFILFSPPFLLIICLDIIVIFMFTSYFTVVEWVFLLRFPETYIRLSACYTGQLHRCYFHYQYPCRQEAKIGQACYPFPQKVRAIFLPGQI